MADTVEVVVLPDCNFHQMIDESVPAAVDGKTSQGPWAYMCEEHFKAHGVGIGTGKGQRLILAKED